MILPTPCAPFTRIKNIVGSVTVDLSGNQFVLFSGDPDIFQGYNEYTLTDGRQLSTGSVQFTDDTDTNTGLHNLLYPWICTLNTSLNYIEFFLFSTRPKKLDVEIENVSNIVNYASSEGILYISSDDYTYTANDSPMITKLVLYPGNGVVYHGKIVYSDLTRDSNSDLIPDALEVLVEGSITKFLKAFDFPTVFYISSDNYFYLSSDEQTLEATR